MVAVMWFVIVVPPLTAALLMCRIARRNALNWRWPIIACTLLALVASFLSVSYRLALAPNEGRMMIGVNFDSSPSWILLSYLPKFIAALGIGLLLVKRAQRQLELETSQ